MHVQHTLEAKIVVQLGRGIRLNIVDHRPTGKADDITHPASRTQPLSNLSPSFHVQDLGCAICSTEVQLQFRTGSGRRSLALLAFASSTFGRRRGCGLFATRLDGLLAANDNATGHSGAVGSLILRRLQQNSSHGSRRSSDAPRHTDSTLQMAAVRQWCYDDETMNTSGDTTLRSLVWWHSDTLADKKPLDMSLQKHDTT